MKQYIAEQLDTNQLFIGSLTGLYTNERGQTTAFYNASTYDRNKFGLIHKDGYKANYGITVLMKMEKYGVRLYHILN